MKPEDEQNAPTTQTEFEPRQRTVEEWFAEIDRLRGGVPFPERAEQPLSKIRDYFE